MLVEQPEGNLYATHTLVKVKWAEVMVMGTHLKEPGMSALSTTG